MSEINTLIGFRTDFSLGESALASEDIADIAVSLGQKHVAVADTMTVSGLIDTAKKCLDKGIELHFGVRLRIVDDPALRGNEGKDLNKTAFYPKVFARNAKGMRQIFKLLSLGTDENHFYYVSRLSLHDVIHTLDPEDVVITTGDMGGLFTRPDWRSILNKLTDAGFIPFAELIPVPIPYFERMCLEALKAIAAEALVPIVTTPILYHAGQHDKLMVNVAIHTRGDFTRAFAHARPYFEGFFPRDVKEVTALIKETVTGMKVSDNTFKAESFVIALKTGNQSFLEETAYRWSREPVSIPSLSPDPAKTVLDACKQGIRDRLSRSVFGYQPTTSQIREDYLPRLKYELDVLTKLGFCDYFLVVADLVNWAKANGIAVGPGRGSIGGSLIAYLMGITDIDPIRFGLLFERFINPSRLDLPDADLDFMSSRREEVISYLEKKYGTDHVAGITNYGTLGGASAIKDVSRIMGVGLGDFTPSKHIPAIHGQPVSLETARDEVAEMQRFAESNPVVFQRSLAVQGMMRSYGRHAAGTIVSAAPLIERAVVENDKGSRKVNWDMRVCEDMGLVKFDVLGLSTLDTIARCQSYVKERHSITLDLEAIPLDDEATLKAFTLGQTVGIFQFEGGAARRILRDMGTGSTLEFGDLVAANALNRPGPLEAGLVEDYVQGRNGSKKAVAHPNMEPALRETFNVIVYQEQVMQVSVDLCGFSLIDADKLRKIMGKKKPEEMAKMRDQFVNGAKSHSGMDETTASALFDQIETFAGYAFNKSHAAEYSLISYICMWLKTHYPVEFYAAALSTVDEKKLQVIVNDAKSAGVSIMPPDINISTDEFVIGNDTTLYIPFNRIKGVSDKGAQEIMRARALSSIPIETTVGRGATKTVMKTNQPVTAGRFDTVEDLKARVEKRLVNSAVVDRLDKVGAFARIVAGSLPAQATERWKDQMVLLPGLNTALAKAERQIPTDKYTRAWLAEIARDIKEVDDKVFHSMPVIGAKPKFMAIVDSPGRDEEFSRRFAEGNSFQKISQALTVTGLEKDDGYWTGLVKRRRETKVISPQDIKTYSPFLMREIELLKPPLIVTLGNNASRLFVPELKGDMMEHVGSIHWNEKLDCMVLIGFNPGRCYIDDDFFVPLCELFETVQSIVL